MANASEIMPRSAIVNGALPLTIRVAGTEPTPMKTRNAVPIEFGGELLPDRRFIHGHPHSLLLRGVPVDG